MAFFLEEELLVAGDAFAESVRFLIRNVKGCGGDGIYACECSRHGFGLAAEEVDVGVVDCLVEARCRCVYVHFCTFKACGLVLSDNLRPKHAGCAEFGQLHEIVGRYAHVELNTCGNFIYRQAGVGEEGEPVGAPCEGVTEFLIDECARVGEHVGIYGQHFEARNFGNLGEESLGGLDDCGNVRFLAMTQGTAEGIVVD